MSYRSSLGALALMAALLITIVGVPRRMREISGLERPVARVSGF
jgi:hypothetical protein